MQMYTVLKRGTYTISKDQLSTSQAIIQVWTSLATKYTTVYHKNSDDWKSVMIEKAQFKSVLKI